MAFFKFRKGDVSARDKFLSNTDGLGKFAGIPIVTQAVNAVNKTKAARAVVENVLGVDKDAWLPEFASTKFRSGAATSTSPDCMAANIVVESEKNLISTVSIFGNGPQLNAELAFKTNFCPSL